MSVLSEDEMERRLAYYKQLKTKDLERKVRIREVLTPAMYSRKSGVNLNAVHRWIDFFEIPVEYVKVGTMRHAHFTNTAVRSAQIVARLIYNKGLTEHGAKKYLQRVGLWDTEYFGKLSDKKTTSE